MKNEIKELIQAAITKLYPEQKDIAFSVEYAPENVVADFASNAALVLAKKVGKKPMEVAAALAAAIPDQIGDPGLDSRFRGNDKLFIAAVSPGFLNFGLSDALLLSNLGRIIKSKDKFGQNKSGGGKMAIVEYFQLNVAKPPHVGHLRSAVIGDSLKKILKFSGYKAVSDTHIGDWGTQFGLLILAHKKFYKGKNIDLKELNHLYIEINRQIEKNPELREEAKQEFVMLERGDPKNRKLWQEFVTLSRPEYEKSSKMLGLLPFEYDLGESFYEDKMPPILKRLEEKGVLQTGESGEKYIDLEKYNLGRLIAVKSDGGTTYELRDLATLAYRYDEITKKEKTELALNLYVVDVRQSHDFKQVFKTMELLGYDVSRSKHVAHGFMSLPEGRISSRKGMVVFLEALLDEAKKRALEIIKRKNPELKNKEKIAAIVGLGAIKYDDLKHNRHSDIVFDWEEALSFEGNTGPYLQYTHARLASILRKAKAKSQKMPKTWEMTVEEQAVMRKLSVFEDIIKDAAMQFQPNILANYLFELAEKINFFYQKVPVTQEEDKDKRNARLSLVRAAAQVLKNGLYLLGIEAPEEM